jgi:hypothetical protein
MKSRARIASVVFAIAIVAIAIKPIRADDTGNTPSAAIDRIMGLIGQGKVDDAMTGDFLKDDPDARQAIRARLIALRDEQQHYYGYDIPAIQRVSPRLQTLWILAYYDEHPVLFRAQFYRPTGQASDPWKVLEFVVETTPSEALKEMPIDYYGRMK